MTDRIAEAAAMVAGARAERRTLEVLPDACRPRDDAEGYAVQGPVHPALGPNTTPRRLATAIQPDVHAC